MKEQKLEKKDPEMPALGGEISDSESEAGDKDDESDMSEDEEDEEVRSTK